jgi:hemolysin D
MPGILRAAGPLSKWRLYAAVKEEKDRTMLRARPPGSIGHIVEFLPAALEIQEAPPSPVGRAVAWTIMAVFAVAILWASLSRIDIVAVAQGKIIPSEYSKVVQPLESGVVTAIHVQNGATVRKGDVLIALDPTVNSADRERLENEHQAVQLDIARLRALIAGKATLAAWPSVAPPLLAVQRQLLHDQLAEHRGRIEAARLVVEQRQAALESTKINLQRLRAIVPILEERAAVYHKLFEKTYASRMQYLETEKERIDKVQELARQEQQLVQDSAALAEAHRHAHTLAVEFKRSHLAELASAETRAASLAREVVKAGHRTERHTLTAPIDGVVQQLAVHTVGGVVTPAQQLMVLVPQHQPLEIEAWIDNKDIGFVHAGQLAEVKIAAFPFTRYGTVKARLVTVSHDAVPLDKSGLVYAARVSLEHAAMPVDGTLVSLSPGMAATVEIKTGTRRLVEYFLSPLFQAGHESLRER